MNNGQESLATVGDGAQDIVSLVERAFLSWEFKIVARVQVKFQDGADPPNAELTMQVRKEVQTTLFRRRDALHV